MVIVIGALTGGLIARVFGWFIYYGRLGAFPLVAVACTSVFLTYNATVGLQSPP